MRGNEKINLDKSALFNAIIPMLCKEPYVAICNSCQIPSVADVKKYELLIAWGNHQLIEIKTGATFESVEEAHDKYKDWIFGVFSYDLKNEVEHLQSKGKQFTEVPLAAFFVPEHVLLVDLNGEVFLCSHSWTWKDFILFIKSDDKNKSNVFDDKPIVHHRISKTEYIDTVKGILTEIEEGNVYELNYCHEFYCQPAFLKNPLKLYESIIDQNPAPFSCYFSYKPFHLISCSPERFLSRTGDELISQPIKGTAPRNTDKLQDEKLLNDLLHSEKERAENVMIVDLVRNDFARSCKTGSIEVAELFGIYSYTKVHQMVSTVKGRQEGGLSLLESLKSCFPMGSMTGAPKIAAMKIIDQIEASSRGWYSGAFGYIAPNGDFDFNVIIRSYVYNENTDYLSVWAGSAVTYDSIPESEYEESLLKANALITHITQW